MKNQLICQQLKSLQALILLAYKAPDPLRIWEIEASLKFVELN